MKLSEGIYFCLGLLVGIVATFVAYQLYSQNVLGRERLATYKLFLRDYSDRDSCLSLSPENHRDNEELLAVVKLVGPGPVGEQAEEHYLTCSRVRADARNANVPVDWFSRTGHSWTQFDRSRAQLVARMAAGLPQDFKRSFQPGGGQPDRQRGAPADTRTR
ncbi:hypothetical protein CCR85_11855 [Rhodothalassium salexigens]|uniref:hypothetical protein n=1 Tax=Rhodothalassium salexigens TaxID=1086 RepID=UPI0019146A56|nr:hypothetical protein [Rhodothalassium salexigens]MBK5912183.1 hypothetical protein [Rhodothalassium salexigens]